MWKKIIGNDGIPHEECEIIQITMVEDECITIMVERYMNTRVWLLQIYLNSEEETSIHNDKEKWKQWN